MATHITDKIKFNGDTYILQDSNALPLTGGTVTGPVTFEDSVSVDDATVGNLVVNGNLSSTNNIQANTINGATVGSNPKFTDTTYSNATTSAAGLMSSSDKSKLDGIAAGAQVNAVTSVAGKTGAVTLAKGDVGLGNVENKSSATIRGELTKDNVTTALGYTPPTTNTTYSAATTSAAGLMSSSDKSKLDGIASGAEVNQNAFSNVKVGSTTVAADGKTDTLELAGSNVTLTPDATNDKVTIGITKANVTSALGYTPPTTDTNTHRPIQVNGTEVLGNNTTALNLKAGSNVSVSNSSGTVTITATNTTYSAGTGLSLSSGSFSVKLGYTTSGNNRAVQADSSGNLYVVQKDDNTNTTYTVAAGDSNGQIKVTPSSGNAYNVSVKGLGSAAYTNTGAYATAAQGTKADTAVQPSTLDDYISWYTYT